MELHEILTEAQNQIQEHDPTEFLWGLGCDFLHQFTGTQICKRQSDIALQRFYPKMMHLCIHFAKKVILLPQYTDTHYKMPIFLFVYLLFLFVAQIEGQIFFSFWDTNKYTNGMVQANVGQKLLKRNKIKSFN
jgi:hypothetical protein